MVNNQLGVTERKNLLDVFHSLDMDGDGTLSLSELSRGTKSLGGKKNTYYLFICVHKAISPIMLKNI